MKNEALLAHKAALGLTSKDEMANFHKAVQDVRDSDMSMRRKNGNFEKDGVVDGRYAGLLQLYEIDYPADYSKSTAPLRVVFFNLLTILTYHCSARSGRVVLNIDGTESQI